MNYTIENDRLKIQISSRGGEMQSVIRDGREYLWQADPQYWDEKAPNLFPYIARMTEGKYVLDGKSYPMPLHGFVHVTELSMEEQMADRIVFRLDSDEETGKCYPFAFTYRVIYELDGDVLHITYQVENHDEKTMYFGIGGHPGFLVPMEDSLGFEDYYLEFEGTKDYDEPVRIGFSPDCFVDGGMTPFPLTNGSKIPLKHSLFDNDAIVLTHTPKTVSLKSDRGTRRVTVSYPDMDYIGFWHATLTEAPYVCIEPWSSLPSRQDIVEDLSTQPGLKSLKAGGVYRNSWSIEIH